MWFRVELFLIFEGVVVRFFGGFIKCLRLRLIAIKVNLIEKTILIFKSLTVSFLKGCGKKLLKSATKIKSLERVNKF